MRWYLKPKTGPIYYQNSMLVSPNSTKKQYLLKVDPYLQQLIQLLHFYCLFISFDNFFLSTYYVPSLE